ncbi:hypothetical protein QS428_13150 [Staphylococcus pseudintermedius]|nr:hypothetical protein QS428_13150 [Staphylococcus pseudintermedius]
MMMERGVTMATINILNKVFSKNVLRELIREGESDLLNKAYYQIRKNQDPAVYEEF